MFQANCSATTRICTACDLSGTLPTRLAQMGTAKHYEENDLDEHHGRLAPGREAALGAGVARHRVGLAAEAQEAVDEEDAPADEEHQHEPMDDRRELIELRAVGDDAEGGNPMGRPSVVFPITVSLRE